jgi:hypothetical protein
MKRVNYTLQHQLCHKMIDVSALAPSWQVQAWGEVSGEIWGEVDKEADDKVK